VEAHVAFVLPFEHFARDPVDAGESQAGDRTDGDVEIVGQFRDEGVEFVVERLLHFIRVGEEEQVSAPDRADLARQFGAEVDADADGRLPDAIARGGRHQAHEAASAGVADVWTFVGELHEAGATAERPLALARHGEAQAQSLLHIGRA